jgi:hypothetical protein
MPPQDSRLTSSERAELRRRDAQTEAILAQLAPPRDSGSPPSLRDILLPRQPEVADPTDAQRAAHEARVRDTQADWGPVRRGVARAADVAGEHVPEFLSGALWGDPTDPDASRANLLGQMLMAGVPLASGLKRGVSRVVNPIKAYHGSPHDFAPEPGAPLGRFKSENIGTGEGAQAYGHGLYFAEKEGTAQAYRQGLSRRDFSRKVSEVYDEFDAPDDAVRALQDAGLSDEQLELVKALQDDGWLGFDYPHQAVDAAMSSNVMNWDPSPATLAAVKRQGRTYEVNIHANPDDFLDWDAPLSQQPNVTRAIQKSGGAPISPESTGADAIRGQLMRGVSDANGMVLSPEQALQRSGIPGIKYLDQGSRGLPGAELVDVTQKDGKWFAKLRGVNAGDQIFTTSAPHATRESAETWARNTIASEGTSNWVVFDDSLIEILKVSGVALPVIEGLRRQAAQNDGAVDITGVL